MAKIMGLITMTMNNQAGARDDVLTFYRELPFNYREDVSAQANAVKNSDSLRAYPPLLPHLKKSAKLLDVGCGAGWLVNAAAYHHKMQASGIDFNSVAVTRAREVASQLQIDASFEVADLFTWVPPEPFELVTSVGVLHHTDDCLGAVRRIARDLVAPGGRFFLGLYHKYGRQPFLDHFAQMRESGESEETMLAAFRDLSRGANQWSQDDVFVRSWFRDQVLHPHETQHTLEEILPILDELGYELEATSINRFGPLPEPEELYSSERLLANVGKEALAEGRYFPGFFIIMARRK